MPLDEYDFHELRRISDAVAGDGGDIETAAESLSYIGQVIVEMNDQITRIANSLEEIVELMKTQTKKENEP